VSKTDHCSKPFSVCATLNYSYNCGLLPNVLAALSIIGGALCSTPQFGWRPLQSGVQ